MKTFLISVQHDFVGRTFIEAGASGGIVQYLWRIRRRCQHRSYSPEGLRFYCDAPQARCCQMPDKAEEL